MHLKSGLLQFLIVFTFILPRISSFICSKFKLIIVIKVTNLVLTLCINLSPLFMSNKELCSPVFFSIDLILCFLRHGFYLKYLLVGLFKDSLIKLSVI